MPKPLPCTHGIWCTVHLLGLGKSVLSDANAQDIIDKIKGVSTLFISLKDPDLGA